MASLRRSLLLVVAGIFAGAGGAYLYREDSTAVTGRIESLKREHREEIERFREAEVSHKVSEREYLRVKQEADALYAEGLRKNLQIKALKQDRLHLVCRLADSEAVRRLLALDPELAQEVFLESSKENFLHQVARSSAFGSGKVAEALIDFGADRNAKNAYGQTPIDVARISSGSEVLRVLQTYRSREVVRVSLNNAP